MRPAPRAPKACPGPLLLSTVLLASLAGCASPPPVPDMPPAALVPDAWRSPVAWVDAEPADHLDKGLWWRAFNDATLNRLVEQALPQHPSLRAAAARLRQAQAGLRLAEAGAAPRLEGAVRPLRQRSSANRPAAVPGGTAVSTLQNDTLLTASVSYELDLFNRIGSEVAAADAGERQARSDLANTRLVLAADLSASYFALRQIDAEISVLQQSMALQQRAVGLLQARREGGAASGLELAQQQAQLDTTATQLALMQRQRPLVEHALATLSGQPAPVFSLPPDPGWQSTLPRLPAVLPAQVLQRRPDVAAAQHALRAASAQVGVARAGFFPSVQLSTSAGFESRTLAQLLSAPSLVWSLGAGLTQPLWDAGRNRARFAAAEASLEASGAGYQRTVLQALQEVEDGLSSWHTLARADRSAQTAVRSAGQALDIAQARYEGGLVTYLEVVSARQALLNNRRQVVQILGQQLVAAVYLVKALGGGWSASEAVASSAAGR